MKYYKGLIFFDLPKTDISTKVITAEDIEYYGLENTIIQGSYPHKAKRMIKFEHKSKEIICAEFPFKSYERDRVYLVLHIA